MPNIAPANMTEHQQQWFASVRDGLHRETGKSLAEWVEIARKCPATGTRARLKWFKDTHGLLVAHGSICRLTSGAWWHGAARSSTAT
jgi:hypothetical protein